MINFSSVLEFNMLLLRVLLLAFLASTLLFGLLEYTRWSALSAYQQHSRLQLRYNKCNTQREELKHDLALEQARHAQTKWEMERLEEIQRCLINTTDAQEWTCGYEVYSDQYQYQGKLTTIQDCIHIMSNALYLPWTAI